MTTEEKIKKAEQEVRAAKMKLSEIKKTANDIRRNNESHRKAMMGGLVAKYLREDMELYFLDLSQEEITRIIAYAMKHKDTMHFIRQVISEREKPITGPEEEEVLNEDKNPIDEE